MAEEQVGFNPDTVTNPSAQAAVDKLNSDPDFKARYFSDDPTIRNFAVDQMSTAQQNASRRSYYVPEGPSVDAAEKQIKQAMADPAFQARYQSNDPNIRGQAVQELSALFYAKVGNRPNSDDPVENTPAPQANSSPSPAPQYTGLIQLGPNYNPNGSPGNSPLETEAYRYRMYGTAGLKATADNTNQGMEL